MFLQSLGIYDRFVARLTIDPAGISSIGYLYDELKEYKVPLTLMIEGAILWDDTEFWKDISNRWIQYLKDHQKEIKFYTCVDNGIVKLKSLKRCQKEGLIGSLPTNIWREGYFSEGINAISIQLGMIHMFGKIHHVYPYDERQLLKPPIRIILKDRFNNTTWAFPIGCVES
ncbi:MAG: hypothetical protein ACP5OA_03420 [Candidatus Woesearchaeota archaeon]